MDFGYLLEYLTDSRSEDQSLALFDNDVLLGFRALFSDAASTSVQGGMIQDLNGRGRVFSLEASRRLGADYRIETEWRVYSDLPSDSSVAVLANLDLVRLSVSRYL